MFGVSFWTVAFYLFTTILVALAWGFILHYWRHANAEAEMRWINIDSRKMYVDAANTMITASGIAIALLASSVFSSRTTNAIAAHSAKIAVVCLIGCILSSFAAIVALNRGYELAQSRYIRGERPRGVKPLTLEQGRLNDKELCWILFPAGFAFSFFLVGFLFLGRIAYHF